MSQQEYNNCETCGTVPKAKDEKAELSATESNQSSRNADHKFPNDLMQQGSAKKQRLVRKDSKLDKEKEDSLTSKAVPQRRFKYQEYIDQLDVIGNSYSLLKTELSKFNENFSIEQFRKFTLTCSECYDLTIDSLVDEQSWKDQVCSCRNPSITFLCEYAATYVHLKQFNEKILKHREQLFYFQFLYHWAHYSIRILRT